VLTLLADGRMKIKEVSSLRDTLNWQLPHGTWATGCPHCLELIKMRGWASADLFPS
jgi:hypothetical protein